jgi:hypothetical protein
LLDEKRLERLIILEFGDPLLTILNEPDITLLHYCRVGYMTRQWWLLVGNIFLLALSCDSLPTGIERPEGGQLHPAQLSGDYCDPPGQPQCRLRALYPYEKNDLINSLARMAKTGACEMIYREAELRAHLMQPVEAWDNVIFVQTEYGTERLESDYHDTAYFSSTFQHVHMWSEYFGSGDIFSLRIIARNLFHESSHAVGYSERDARLAVDYCVP